MIEFNVPGILLVTGLAFFAGAVVGVLIAEHSKPKERDNVHLYSLDDVQEAYETAYYDGAGKQAYEEDHDVTGELLPHAWVTQPMEDYLRAHMKNGWNYY